MDQRRCAGVFGTRLLLTARILCAAVFVFAIAWSSAHAQDATPVVAPEAPQTAVPTPEPTAPTSEPAAADAAAQGSAMATAQPTLPVSVSRPDQACVLCHVGSEAVLTLPSGDSVPVGIDPALLDSSVHGSHAAASVYCTDCHAPRQRYLYPHVPTDATNLDEFRADVAVNCESCHTPAKLHNPGHLQAAPDQKAPNCVDCHGGHNAQPAVQIYAEPTQFCQSCHLIADMSNKQVRFAHTTVVANLGADQDCRTCHSDQPQTQSQQCTNCHSLLDAMAFRALSSEPVHLKVNPTLLTTSVHGDRVIQGVPYPPLQCVDCHKAIAESGFPHPEEILTDRETLRTAVEKQCVDCHNEVGGQYADGIHAQHVAAGELNAASCADCHGSHAIQPPNVPRTRVSDTCGACHEDIYTRYKASVHGSALYGRNNPDVPVCTDCHGAHQIDDPRTAAFRLSSPVMCGTCHADEELMTKYAISTNVFDSYVSDFHGKTVTLFEHNSPNEATNKAVCYDCHGVHDIQSVSDQSQAQIRERLLVTCQKCHPDASENFPSAWMSHYEPSLEHYPLVYLVTLFYKILIPTVLGGFLLFIGSDIFRRTSDRFVRRREANRSKKSE